MNAYLIRGASVLGGEARDIGISEGIFVDATDLSGASGVTVLDAQGLVALPGLVDLHTHLRQPGMEQAETVVSGSQAAALGGFTAIHAMANTNPVADNPGVTDMVHAAGAHAGYVTVRPVGAVTKGLEGQELAEIEAMANGQAGVRVFSDDGKCVADSLLMLSAMARVQAVGGVIAQHAQDPRLTLGSQMNEGAIAGELGLTGWPSVAEEVIIARDVLLAEHLGARIHICHLSTAGSIDVIRWAKKRGIAVTAEVTPHHLMLTEDLLLQKDPVFKVNPPLRRLEDTLALREAIASGVIDIVATDHAPHPSESKTCRFEEAAFGMLGLEMALPVVVEALVEPGLLDWAGVARVMSTAPAQIGSLPGYEKPVGLGQPAHLALVDAKAFARGSRASLSSNDPYAGSSYRGLVTHTFHEGVMTVSASELVGLEDLRKSTHA